MVVAVRAGQALRAVARSFRVSLCTVQRWVAHAGRRPEGDAGGDGRPHEEAGRGAGRKTATRRRRPAPHTGHRVRSTPISRNRRVTTGSGAAGRGTLLPLLTYRISPYQCQE